MTWGESKSIESIIESEINKYFNTTLNKSEISKTLRKSLKLSNMINSFDYKGFLKNELKDKILRAEEEFEPDLRKLDKSKKKLLTNSLRYAIRYALNDYNKNGLNIKLFEELGKKIPNANGIRKKRVRITKDANMYEVYWVPDSPEAIYRSLTELVIAYEIIPKLKNKELFNIEKAARVQAVFVKSHPYEDGNGRISRVIMNAILARGNKNSCFPMIYFTKDERKKYIDHENKALKSFVERKEKILEKIQMSYLLKENEGVHLKGNRNRNNIESMYAGLNHHKLFVYGTISLKDMLNKADKEKVTYGLKRYIERYHPDSDSQSIIKDYESKYNQLTTKEKEKLREIFIEEYIKPTYFGSSPQEKDMINYINTRVNETMDRMLRNRNKVGIHK